MAGSLVSVGSGDHRVIAVHGWFGSARGWGSLPGYLDGSAYTYVFPDLPGYGDRREAGGEFSMAGAAAEVIALADGLGWDRFSVVGHSMGGKIGLQVLLQAPGRVRRLVGVNPVPASALPFDEQSWALFSGAPANPGNRAAIIDFTTGNRLTKTFIDQIVQHSLDNSAVEAFAAYLPDWAKGDFAAQVTGNEAAIKVIVGDQDPALSAELMQATYLAMFPRAEMAVLANAGHYPMFETPVALATTIEEFLGRE